MLIKKTYIFHPVNIENFNPFTTSLVKVHECRVENSTGDIPLSRPSESIYVKETQHGFLEVITKEEFTRLSNN